MHLRSGAGFCFLSKELLGGHAPMNGNIKSERFTFSALFAKPSEPFMLLPVRLFRMRLCSFIFNGSRKVNPCPQSERFTP